MANSSHCPHRRQGDRRRTRQFAVKRQRKSATCRSRVGVGGIMDTRAKINPRGKVHMTYYVFKVFWLIAAPTSALVLISASAALWAALVRSKCAVWLAAAAACGLVIAAFTPIGGALTMPLEHRFGFSPPDSPPPDGIIVLRGTSNAGIIAASTRSRAYPKARITFSGYHVGALHPFVHLGGDSARVSVEGRPRTTFEDALYSAALLRPKPGDRWLLVTAASHMP